MPTRQTLLRAAVYAVAVGYLIWSVATETLLPLWTAGRTTEFWLNLVGIPIQFGGLALLVIGASAVIQVVLAAQADPAFRQLAQTGGDTKEKQEAFARSDSLHASWQARWRPRSSAWRWARCCLCWAPWLTGWPA